jgi:hypothetical protein
MSLSTEPVRAAARDRLSDRHGRVGSLVPPAPFRFVVVEDEANPDIRLVAANMAAAAGYAMLAAASGRTILMRSDGRSAKTTASPASKSQG